MATRYDPFREMERLMNTTMRQGPLAPGMPLDLYRDGDRFVAEIDLPGVDPSSIDIDIEDRTLTIRAERRSVSGEGLEWLTHERPTGTFARQIGLGLGVAPDRIEADYADGVLTLTIPVAEEAKPRKIQVSHSKSSTIEHEDKDSIEED
ncbi:MAG: Hsp20/alpha crystallin family protein [Bowdeniella nasicola]|nr:Hsp20/alpha crystallin family protein [Bowdeniella nasicola]